MTGGVPVPQGSGFQTADRQAGAIIRLFFRSFLVEVDTRSGSVTDVNHSAFIPDFGRQVIKVLRCSSNIDFVDQSLQMGNVFTQEWNDIITHALALCSRLNAVLGRHAECAPKT